jgi:hypothetical protein
MGLILKAGAAFTVAAYFLGTGPFAGLPDPHWEAVKADLEAARPQERLAEQVRTVFRPGTPHPDLDR